MPIQPTVPSAAPPGGPAPFGGDATPDPKKGYRRSVGIFLLNRAGRVFVGRRLGLEPAAWQMPQGGIDPGEEPVEAGLREMAEEIGTSRALFLSRSAVWRSYDLPPEIAATIWGGRYHGQTQLWIAYRLLADDAAIQLETHHQEFSAWQWVEPEAAVQLIVPFKRAVYASVVEEFRPLWAGSGERAAP